MHRVSSWIAAVAALFLCLAGCGGGDSPSTLDSSSTGSGGGTTTTPPPPVPASLTVLTSAASVPADGSGVADITVLAKDANNNAMKGVTVTLAASAGELVASSNVTDASGLVTATLSGGGVAAGTTITVTASAGGATAKTQVGVVATQQNLSLLTSLSQIPSDGSKTATITALVKDSSNNVVPGATVNFQASSGALTVTQAVTDTTGVALATLSSGADPTNRTITVTAALGSATSTVTVAVAGTTLGLTCPANLVLNSVGNCSVALANSAGQGIPNATVTVASKNNNTLSAASLTTDGNGHAAFTVTGVAGGNDTITATGMGMSQTATVAISLQSFNITAPTDGTIVGLGAPGQQVTVTWLSNGQPVVGQPVSFAATRGTIVPSTSVNTDANGHASATISSTSAGPVIVQATATSVSAQLNLNFVAATPSQISVQPAPAAVALQGQSTITALVRDANNNLVQGATIDFQVVTDPTNGGLSTASATTDAQGRATTIYTAGNSSSGANGVSISATVAGSSVAGTTTLTVGGQAVFLSLGTGNTVDTSQGPAVYQITYSVFAVDSHGAGLPNVPITVSVLPVAYGKGAMGCVGSNWAPSYSTSTLDQFAYNGQAMCVNEDSDYTGNISSLDSGTPSTCTDLATNPNTQIANHAKDYNCNGQLDPANVAVVAPSSGVTDSTGRLDVKVTWPRDHSFWVEVTLVAATQVSGTQSSTSSTFVLPGAASDYSNCPTTAPPGPFSPYGLAATCKDPR